MFVKKLWLLTVVLVVIGIHHLIKNKFNHMAAKQIFTVDFEVFGKVQGVFFRKYTEKQAQQLNLKGWCMNTAEGTVKGQLEGPKNEMKHWLQNKGSPSSRIDKAIFSEMIALDDYTFKKFGIKR